MPIQPQFDHSRIGVHTPWTDDDHDSAVQSAKARAERWNRRQRRFADAAFFVAAAAAGTILLNRDALPSWGVSSLILVGAVAAWFALRAGSRVRSVGCMVQEWAADIGEPALSAEAIQDLEQRSRACPAVLARVRDWQTEGYVLRQRDQDIVVEALCQRGIEAPLRSRQVSDEAFAEAL